MREISLLFAQEVLSLIQRRYQLLLLVSVVRFGFGLIVISLMLVDCENIFVFFIAKNVSDLVGYLS